jgi:phosphatidylinositol glycan class Z
MGITSWYEKDESLRAAYFVLVILRFLFSCFVQNGYLYPDEFFQSSEIMARDILQINSTITWEWNEAFPVRSPISAFLTSGIPFLFLKLLSKFADLPPYLFLIFPRIYITFISLLSFDIPVYIISQRLKLKPFYCLFVLSTSYVTHVFATRPFSNTLETGIFGILLVLFTHPDNIQLSRSRLEVMPIYKCILIGSLTSLGVFCRQTFLVFALVPYLGYLICQVKRQTHMLQIVDRLMFMALGFLITTVVFVLLDSWYFGYLEHGKIVLTSWNFIKYNSLQSHTHGHHPFFTHFLVNIPLLFGPIAFLFYFKLGSLLLSRFCGSNQLETKSQVDLGDKKPYKISLVLCVFVPVLILSFIPHQEPRFMMPVILPLVLLFSSKVVGLKYSPTILMSWSIWNVIGCIFFGVLHQGGVVPSLLHLHKVINQKVHSSTESYCHHVVYFHTYMPPTHLLAWPNKVSINGHKLYIHDLAGSSQETFDQTMSKLKSDYCVKNRNMVRMSILLRLIHTCMLKNTSQKTGIFLAEKCLKLCQQNPK